MDSLLLTKVMDLLLDAICVVDAEGRFVFASAACERIFGYTPEELIGRNMIDLVLAEDRERTLQAAKAIMDGRPQTHFENRYVRKDGRVVDIMWSARWSEADQIRLAVARDITESKRAAGVNSALYQISEAAQAAEDLPALYRHIHKIIGGLLPADNFTVALYDKSNAELSFPYFIDERKQTPEPQSLASGSRIAEVIHSGQTLLTSADDTDTGSGNASWLGAPLISHTGIIGALVLQTYSRDGGYTNEDKELLQFVSTQIAIAIERKQTETKLRHMACHDALTDIPNRTLFNDRFDVALQRAHRNGERLALLYLDLNGFKLINDTFGHEAGDLLLREIARRLTECVRAGDTVGRMGGDEFTVLLTNIREPENVNIVAQKIRAAVCAPFELAGRTMSVSASVGTAVYPEQGDEREQLFRQADAGMYAEKTTPKMTKRGR